MTTRGVTSVFAGFRFPREVIAVAVRWYLRYGLSYRDVEELLAERGVTVDHVTVYRWVQRFTPEFIEAARLCRHIPGDCWFVDETYVKVSAGGPICTGRLTSMARSSTCCCLCGGTWPQPAGSSPGRCAQAPSRPRSLPNASNRAPSATSSIKTVSLTPPVHPSRLPRLRSCQRPAVPRRPSSLANSRFNSRTTALRRRASASRPRSRASMSQNRSDRILCRSVIDRGQQR